ncbi:MAG: hypothetical protein HEQ32_05845 [Vampirovibrio sp.]
MNHSTILDDLIKPFALEEELNDFLKPHKTPEKPIGLSISKPSVENVSVSIGLAETSLNQVSYQAKHPEQALLKRVLEIVFSTVALAFSSPIFAWVAFLSKQDDPEASLWVHYTYVGQNQVLIQIPAFRILEEEDLPWEQAWLKALGIQHLPKLLSLYRGELSLVGPRLLTQSDLQTLNAQALSRFQSVPGLCGLEQVVTKYTSSCPASMKERLDLDYLERWTIYLDAALLWMSLTTRPPKQVKPKNTSARRIQITVSY